MRLVSKMKSRLGKNFWPFALFCCALTWYAGSKHVYVSWDSVGFTSPTVTVDTNTWDSVTFAWDTSTGLNPTAQAVCYCTYPGQTNIQAVADLTNIATVAMSAKTLTVTSSMVPGGNVTNVVYLMVCTAQTQTVVTNGVFHVPCADTGTNNVWVPIGVRVYSDGWRLSPDASVKEPAKPERLVNEALEEAAE